MKRRREASREASAGAEEDGGASEEDEKTEEKGFEVTHFSHGDGRGGFRAAALLGAETDLQAAADDGNDAAAAEDEDDADLHDDDLHDDEDGELHRSAYVAYVITDDKDKPQPYSLRPPVVAKETGKRLVPTPADRGSAKGTMALVHTYTPASLRGRGFAERLCVEAFTWAASNQLRVNPECSYISETFLCRRPEFWPHVIPRVRRLRKTRASNTSTREPQDASRLASGKTKKTSPS